MRRGIYGVAVIAALSFAVGFVFVGSASAEGPIKWILSWHVGGSVNGTLTGKGAPQEERNECTIPSGDTCELGERGTGPREFDFDESVAVSALTGDIYITDLVNHRVQVLDAEGDFVSTFGWNVNMTKVALGGAATQAEKDVCTAESHDACGKGEAGAGLAAQMSQPTDISVDPTSGHLYVYDIGYDRVDEYGPTGEFLLAIGGHVNGKGGNVCTASEACQPATSGAGLGEFAAQTAGGNRITVGAEDHLLYVGDIGRIEKFDELGAVVGEASAKELSSTGLVTNVAVDASGNLFVTDSAASGVHELAPNGSLGSCVINNNNENLEHVAGIAFDAYGRLGVVGYDVYEAKFSVASALIYQAQGADCGKTVGGAIVPPSGEVGKGTYQKQTFEAPPADLAFDLHKKSAGLPGEDQVYIANTNGFFSEVEGYRAVLFPEVRTCTASKILSTSASLCGEINPQTVAASGFFMYGMEPSKLESKTTPLVAVGSGEAFVPFGFELSGLTPNQVYWDEAWVEAEAEGKPATAGGPPPLSFHTSTPPPEIEPPEPPVSVRETSAVLKATVNPEHAPASYHFEYASCASLTQSFGECSSPQSTEGRESARYGTVGVTQEISGLEPNVNYVYRLAADNRFEYNGRSEGGVTSGAEGHFTTELLAVPAAETGSATAVTATTALISGVVVPDGQPAIYSFELGLWEGTATQFGVVFSASTGDSVVPIVEERVLSGLQPGMTYAFRIEIQSGYGQQTGAPVTFTTAGSPLLLPAPGPSAQLPIPLIAFPKEPKGGSGPTVSKLSLALKVCRKQAKRRRTLCEKAARKKYGAKKRK
jgi:hypothetical protein